MGSKDLSNPSRVLIHHNLASNLVAHLFIPLIDILDNHVCPTLYDQLFSTFLNTKANASLFLLFFAIGAYNGPSMQFEILHLVIKLVIGFLLAFLLLFHKVSVFTKSTGSLNTYRFIVSYSHYIFSNETVFFIASRPALLFPILADEIVIKVTFLCIVFLCYLAREVLNLKVWETNCEVNRAPNQRVKRNIHLVVFKPILSQNWQGDTAIWVFDVLVMEFLCRLFILVVNGEIDIKLNFGALKLCRAFDRRSWRCRFNWLHSAHALWDAWSHILTVAVAKVKLARSVHVPGYYLKVHVGIRYDVDDFGAARREHLVAVFVSNQALQVIVQRVALDSEFPHHLPAVDSLVVIEAVHSLFLNFEVLVCQLHLVFDFFIFLDRVGADVVFEVPLMFLNLHCKRLKLLLSARILWQIQISERIVISSRCPHHRTWSAYINRTVISHPIAL